MSLALDKLGERAKAIEHARDALAIREQIETPTPPRCGASWRSGGIRESLFVIRDS